MQSDYKRIGFNASPRLQQVVFLLLAFPLFEFQKQHTDGFPRPLG